MNTTLRAAALTPTPRLAPQALELIPVGDAPLETSLIAFDRLFDPCDPLGPRAAAGWTLTPYIPPARRGGAVALEARRLLTDGATILRLTRNGEDIAVAAIRAPLPTHAPMHQAATAHHAAPALRIAA